MTKDEALDLALEALEYIHEGANNQGPHTGISWRCVAVKAEPAITAIKQARSAPVQELPVFGPPIGILMKMEGDETRKLYPLKQKPAPVQEPVAWRFTGIAGFKRFVTDAQYKAFLPEVRTWYEPFKCESCTTPPAAQRQWVGLTDEEIDKTHETQVWDARRSYARAIEAKLKEKNT